MGKGYYVVKNHLYFQSTAVRFKIGIPLNIFWERPTLSIWNCGFTFADISLPMQTYDYSVFIMDPLFEIAINPAQGTPQIPIMNQSPMIVSFFKDKILFGSTNILI